MYIVCCKNLFLTTIAFIASGSLHGSVGIQRYSSKGGGLGKGEYIYLGDFGVDRYHITIQQNTHSILSNSWFHTLVLSCCRSMQYVWFLVAGYSIISSYPHSRLL